MKRSIAALLFGLAVSTVTNMFAQGPFMFSNYGSPYFPIEFQGWPIPPDGGVIIEVLWVSRYWPHLEIDRLNDPRIRMSNYWDNVSAGFRRQRTEMKIIESRMKAESVK